MQHAMSLVCLAAVLVGDGPQTRGQQESRPGDAMGVAKQESATYVKAFNDRNMEKLAALFTPDADFMFLQGATFDRLEFGLVSGEKDIVEFHRTFFSVYPHTRLTETVTHARLIRPDVLIADLDFAIQGFGKDEGSIHGRAVILRVKEAGSWKIAASRNVSRDVSKK